MVKTFLRKRYGEVVGNYPRAQVTVRPTSASSSTLVLSRLISFPVYIQEIWNQSGATRAIDWLYSCKYLCLWCIASTKPGIVIGFFFLGWFDDFDSGEPSACVWEIIFLFAQYCPDVQWVWVKWVMGIMGRATHGLAHTLSNGILIINHIIARGINFEGDFLQTIPNILVYL